MLYAAPILSGVSSNLLKRLETIHSTALRIICGAFHTSPILSVRAECGIPSFNELIEQRTALYAIKFESQEGTSTDAIETNTEYSSSEENSSGELWHGNQQPRKMLIQQRGREIILDLRIYIPKLSVFSTPKTAPWTRRKFTVDKSLLKESHQLHNAQALRQFFQHRKATRYRIYTTIYTDGSRQNGRNGFSVVVESLVIRKRMYDIGGIFAAESAAVKEAMNWIANQDKAGAFLICTDSLSVITALEKMKVCSKWKDDMIQLNDMCIRSNKEVVFQWVPSHIGISGNERADIEAKAALADLIDGGIKPEHSLMKTTIKNRILERWQENWYRMRDNKLREVKDSVRPYVHSAGTRKENVILTRLRIGHTLCTHRYLLGKEEQPRCERCNQRLSVKHLICYCPALEDERRKVGLPNSLRDALADDHDSIKTTLEYIRNIDMFDKI